MDAYSWSLVALGLIVIITLVQSPLSAIPKQAEGLSPGSVPDGGNDSRAYRIHRAYSNSAENLPAIAAGLLIAVLAGAAPWFVNLLLWIILASRALHWLVYVQGVGKAHAGLRTACYVIGWGANLVLVVVGIVAAL